MYNTIMVPVDLAHLDVLGKAMQTAADLAKHYDATVYYIGVTASAPSAVAHNPTEYTQKLEQLAAEQASRHGISARAKAMVSHDPTIDLDDALRHAGEQIGADLVVMASHVPGFADHLFHSHGGYLASHSSISVFVVR